MEDIVLYPGVERQDSGKEIGRSRSKEQKISGNIAPAFRILYSKESTYNAKKSMMKHKETQIQTQENNAADIDLLLLSRIEEIQRPKQSLPYEKKLPPLCRLCAIPSNDMIDLFGPSILYESITKKIQYCLPITVNVSDTISKQVCRLCLEKLELCYRFHETVTQAEKQLLLLHEQTTGTVSAERNVTRSSSQSKRQRIVVENADSRIKLVRDADNTERNGVNNLEKDDQRTSPSRENRNTEPLKETRTTAAQSEENNYSNAPNSSPLYTEHEEEELESENVGSKTENYFPPNSERSSEPRITSQRLENVESPCSLGKKKPREYSEKDNRHSSNKVIENHVPVEARVENESITCQICKEILQTFEKCQIHAAIHTGLKNYPCCICNESFGNRRKRKTHWLKHSADAEESKKKEVEELPKECDLKLYDAYKEQINQKDSETGRKFRCPECSRALISNELLEKHMKNCIYKTRRFTCDYCKKLFKWKVNLSKHIITHTGERPFGCDFCPKKFKSRNGMYSHYKFHTGERPFSCSICKKSFRSFFALKQHNLYIHTDAPLHTCTICDKRFKRKYARDIHLRRHTEKKFYKCDLCDVQLSYRSGLVSHKKRIHNIINPAQSQGDLSVNYNF